MREVGEGQEVLKGRRKVGVREEVEEGVGEVAGLGVLKDQCSKLDNWP